MADSLQVISLVPYSSSTGVVEFRAKVVNATVGPTARGWAEKAGRKP